MAKELKESTIKEYNKKLTKLDESRVDFKDTDKVLAFLVGFAGSTQKAYLSAIKWKHGQAGLEFPKVLQEKINELYGQQNERDKSQVMTPKQKLNYVPWEDILALKDIKLEPKGHRYMDEDNVPKGMSKSRFDSQTIFNLYTLQAPVRADYVGMIISWNEERGTEDENEVVLKTRTTSYFVFRDYKTSGTYGVVRIPMNPELYDLEFAKVKKPHPPMEKLELTLFDVDKKTFTEMVTYTFTERLKKTEKYAPQKVYEGTPEYEEYYNKYEEGLVKKAPRFRNITEDKKFLMISPVSIGIDMLRHSYIMYMYPKLKTIKEKEDLAKRMLHSTTQQEKYNLVGKEDEEEVPVTRGAGRDETEDYSRVITSMSPSFKKHLENVWGDYFIKKFGYGYDKPKISQQDYADFKTYLNKLPREEHYLKTLQQTMKDFVEKKFAA